MELKKGYKMTEVGVIPEDWVVKKLSEIFKLKNGYAFSSVYFSETGPIVITPGNFKLDGGLIFNEKNTNRYSGSFLPTMLFSYGDLLIVMTDLTPDCNLLGKPGIIKTNERILHNQRIGKINPITKTINPAFLYWFFLSNSFSKRMKETATGSTVRHTSNGSIYNSLIAVPTNAEQAAIATVLSDTDALISSLEKLIAKKKMIKQGAMQELLKPKDGWELKTFGEVFDFLSTAAYSRADLTENDEIRYVHYGDIHTKWDMFLDISANELPTINTDKVKNYSYIEDGDLIMADASEDYAGISKSVEVKNTGSVFAISGLHTFLLRDKNNFFVNGFRGYIYLMKGVKTQFDRLATGLKVYGVSKNNLKTVVIPIPPKKEQTMIASVLSDIETEISALERKLVKFKTIKQGMMQVLLTGKIRLV
jgi:type I restriction enzyme, S subunit